MSNLKTIGAIDSNFILDIQNSITSVWLAGRIISSMGYSVTIHPTFIRPKIEEISSYSDSGDLEVFSRLYPSNFEVVEVKRIQYTFTSALDFTEEKKFTLAIVCNCHNFDTRTIKPTHFVVFNQNATHYYTVNVKKTQHLWRKIVDNDRGRDRSMYLCPLEAVRFYTLSPDDLVPQAGISPQKLPLDI